MPTINRSLSLSDGDTAEDILQGTVIQSLGPGIHRLKLSVASDGDVEHNLKVDSDLAVDDAIIFPTIPLNPADDVVFRGKAEGGSNLLYSVSNNTGSQAEVQIQFEVERIR